MNKWAGKHVAVVGLGISNMPLIEYLLKQGASISGRDRKTEAELVTGHRHCAGWVWLCALGHITSVDWTSMTLCS